MSNSNFNTTHEPQDVSESVVTYTHGFKKEIFTLLKVLESIRGNIFQRPVESVRGFYQKQDFTSYDAALKRLPVFDFTNPNFIVLNADKLGDGLQGLKKKYRHYQVVCSVIWIHPVMGWCSG